MKKCQKCGFENPDNAKYCGNCGENIEIIEVDLRDLQKEATKPNGYATTSICFAAVAAVVTIFASGVTLCLFGLTMSVISIAILAVGYLKNKMRGVYRLSLFLNIYSFIANFFWLAYHLWIAPGL